MALTPRIHPPAFSSCFLLPFQNVFLFLYSQFCPNTWKQVRQTTAGQIPAGERTPGLCTATRTGLEPLLRGPQLNHSLQPLAAVGLRRGAGGEPLRPWWATTSPNLLSHWDLRCCQHTFQPQFTSDPINKAVPDAFLPGKATSPVCEGTVRGRGLSAGHPPRGTGGPILHSFQRHSPTSLFHNKAASSNLCPRVA